MKKKTDGILFRFALIFVIFTLVSLLLCGGTTYLNQMRDYKSQCLDNIRNIGDYLERLIQDSGDDFISYQKYYMEHFAEIDIPYDFDEFHEAHKKCQLLLAQADHEKYKELSDFNFENFSDEMKKQYFIYDHEFWLLTFENARQSFGLPYTYYLVPKEKELKMVYMIDGERSHKDEKGQKADKGKYIYLGDEYYDPIDKYPVQWNTWFSGIRQDEFQVWNNEWGHTYAYYIPVIIKGQKLGLIGVEVNVSDVNKVILKNTIVQTAAAGAILFFCVFLMLLFVNDVYIARIVMLESDLREYTSQKNPDIAKKIEGNIKGKDEISSLTRSFVNLIYEIRNHVSNIIEASKQLEETQLWADKMSRLANKDPLTGVKNKTAYDSEVLRLEWEIANRKCEFGIVMVDLNFLKLINDTFGHSQGDIAIKKLSAIVCGIFEHSPVFRIGGDEFLVIVEGTDYKELDSRIESFKAKMDEIKADDSLEPWEKISAAIGFAIYDKNNDGSVLNVFRRADKAMYSCKKEMKAVRTD